MKWRDIDKNYVARLDELKQQTPYEILGVDESSSLTDVKKAYRKKVSLYHPDRTDPFMTDYSLEVVKLLNSAMRTLEKRMTDKALSSDP